MCGDVTRIFSFCPQQIDSYEITEVFCLKVQIFGGNRRLLSKIRKLTQKKF